MYLDLPESYHYLNQSGCMSIDEVDDAAEFADVLTAMQTLQFSDETIHSMLSVIAGMYYCIRVCKYILYKYVCTPFDYSNFY